MEKSKFSARVLALWVVCWLRFQDDEIDWTHALDALKRARVQLDELDLDQESSQNPAKFFDKVRGAPAAPPNPRVGWRKLSGFRKERGCQVFSVVVWWCDEGCAFSVVVLPPKVPALRRGRRRSCLVVRRAICIRNSTGLPSSDATQTTANSHPDPSIRPCSTTTCIM